MEILTVNRKIFTDISTISDFYYRDEFFSSLIELSCRRKDEKGLFPIPAGRYEVIITESEKFNRMMPLLVGVPKRSGIRIHWANRAQELDGCLAPGIYNEKTPDFVGSSRKTFDALFEKLKAEKESIYITITGGIKA